MIQYHSYEAFCKQNESNKFTIDRIDKKSNSVILTTGRVVTYAQVMQCGLHLTNPSMFAMLSENARIAVEKGVFFGRSFTIDEINRTKEKDYNDFQIDCTIHGTEKKIRANLTQIISAVTSKKMYLTNPSLLSDAFAYMSTKEARNSVSQSIRGTLENILKHCATHCHSELPFKYKVCEDDVNSFITYAKVIEDFKLKLNSPTDTAPIDILQTKFTVFKNNKVGVKVYSNTKKKVLYEFKMPFGHTEKGDTPEDGFVEGWLKDNYLIFMGLCGYVERYNIQNHFAQIGTYTSSDYQGIQDYTFYSTCNAYMRGSRDSEEMVARSLRTIQRCDEFFAKSQLTQPMLVFRGVPYTEGRSIAKGAVEQGKSFDNLDGYVQIDPAYQSTTMNFTSSLFFAGKNGKKGVVYVIELPAGLRAIYAHNIAGWVEQFEVVPDRYIDIVVDKTLLKFKDSGGCEYNVVKARAVPHAPCSERPASETKDMSAGNPERWYDEYGRISYAQEWAESSLHAAYQLLHDKGVDVQYQKAGFLSFVDSDYTQEYPPMIVARLKSEDSETNKDIGFNLSGNCLEVRRINTKAKLNTRRNNANTKGMHWEEYGLGYSFADTEDARKETMRSSINDIDLGAFDQVRRIAINGEVTPQSIASRIYDYLKYQKNCVMFPLINIARYFDMCMTQVIISEGYELHESIRVERQVSKELEGDAQAGYVPCQYVVNGDNDDHLTIRIKFERDPSSRRLLVHYAGKSDSAVLQETKRLSFDIFNDNIMIKLCMSIFYEFEKKMKLSRTRKIDRLIEYFCMQTGSVAVEDRSALAKAVNGHRIDTVTGSDGKEVVRLNNFSPDIQYAKAYKVWNRTHSGFFQILTAKLDPDNYNLDTSVYDNVHRVTTSSGATKPTLMLKNTIGIDTRYNIYVCYKRFVEGLMAQEDRYSDISGNESAELRVD